MRYFDSPVLKSFLSVILWAMPVIGWTPCAFAEDWEKAYVKINFDGGRLDKNDKVVQRIEKEYTIKPGVKYFDLPQPIPDFGKEKIFPHYPIDRGIPIHASVERVGGKNYFRMVATLADDNKEGLNVDTRLLKVDFALLTDTPSGTTVENFSTKADLAEGKPPLQIYLTLWSAVFDGDLAKNNVVLRPQYTEGAMETTVTESEKGFSGKFKGQYVVAHRSGAVAVENVAVVTGEFFIPWETGAYKFPVFK